MYYYFIQRNFKNYYKKYFWFFQFYKFSSPFLVNFHIWEESFGRKLIARKLLSHAQNVSIFFKQLMVYLQIWPPNLKTEEKTTGWLRNRRHRAAALCSLEQKRLLKFVAQRRTTSAALLVGLHRHTVSDSNPPPLPPHLSAVYWGIIMVSSEYIRDLLTSFSPSLDFFAISSGDGRIKVRRTLPLSFCVIY